MAKMKKVQLIRYAPFDVPNDESELIHGNDTIHIGASAFTSVVGGEIKWFVRAEFADWVKLVVERGGERSKDYIITMHKNDTALPVVTLHTTHDFISQEDA
jgi:hypothetical protein